MSDTIIFKKRIELIAMLPRGSVVAEVGVYKGHFSFEMLELPNLGHLYLVDPWAPQPGYDDPLANTDHEANLAETQAVLRGHTPHGRVEILRMTSREAGYFLHKCNIKLDAVYIDANHSYESVYDDLRVWSQLVKPGGYLMGHDHTDNETAKKHSWGVVRAVSDFCFYHECRLTHLTAEEFPSFCLRKP